jgi:PTS system galactitol-specific IIA component
MIDAALCLARLDAKSAEEVVRALAKALFDAGRVKGTYAAAAAQRERRMPTGLPFPDIAAALPHADPEHVIAPGVAVATLAAPVKFRQMGDPAVQLDVRLVVMPAFSAKEQAAAELTKLIARLQDAKLREALIAAPDAEALSALLEGL